MTNELDWRSSKNANISVLGASNHSKTERETNDYYATDPRAVELLLEKESFSQVLEPACGEGHISKVLLSHNIDVTSSDLIERGYGETVDFFKIDNWNGDIVTNPPYKYAREFVEHALSIIPEENKVAMFLKIQFLEGQARRVLFDKTPPKKVYVCSKRLSCAKNGDFLKYSSGAVCFAWFIWKKGYTDLPRIDWIN